MLKLEETVLMQIRNKQNASIKQIARETGRSRNTVRKYLRSSEPPGYKKRPPRSSKLDAYKAYLQERVQKAHPFTLPATVLLDEIQARGYCGQITILRSFLRSLMIQPPEKIVRFETEPGKQAQVDWTTIRKGSLYAFVMILGYSRKAYVEFTESQDELTLLRCHVHAFEYFGGVPQQALYDNMKTVVIERDKYGPGRHGYQKTFLDFSKHYGFEPKLCWPNRPQTKGKVERFIGYVQASFYRPLVTARSVRLDELNYATKCWLREKAEKRFLKERSACVKDLFLDEQAHLHMLPPAYALCKPHCPSFEIKQHALTVYDALVRCV